ncbi:conserved Plasmodium protein, unknown function [Plasmodium berghei]|uniref:HP12 protein homolog, putative n=2 Tax=Plasmodium berghei TaxID=5821 RepID=A0A509AL20_PLABA|nr:HP12 protein homolog, putative [Plasmodium berghei ANKA]CXI50872.1 conserved Plasmodium protein, unknown function [Plasmodium berghei]SCL94341.1 conserved Plasmodium protein, unknown function [Plasmodium berghei]SCM15995.1 conserved Plasmodium protein, unknown function [Plasmodium berghei]SCM17791.1 conserved Plasmodium protein, unknown function [Plasmodium berghei]SCN26028.1 conserved Plasmodium protein, unknown function [Plasmodium berghei]|eukprot:XP_034421920.1 HP12 protein homolog, putative [Plasmodium berghei ANKA]
MTICSGCGITTGANICCPVCLKHNKEAFYCSQECFEKNYNDHKNIHYFIKLTNNDDLHKKNIYENDKSPISNNPNLSIIILDEEIEKDKLNGNTKLNNYFLKKKKSDSSTMDGEGMNVIIDGLNNEMLNIENIGKKNDMHIFQENQNKGNAVFFTRETNLNNVQNDGDNIEYNQNTKNLMFENYQRKKNYHKYNNVKNYYLFDTMDNKSKDQENESINKTKFSKNFFKNNKISSYINTIAGYIYSYKYNIILPYYQDIQNKDDKINVKNNNKTRVKLTDKKIMELKKQFKTKKIFKIAILLILISIIVIISTCVFSYILETSQKNILMNSENRLNQKNNTNKDSEVADLKSYITAFEELRQEIYEMKEVLYAHNIQINKNFHLNNSYSIFENFSKIKPITQIPHNKRVADKLNSLTSHSFYDNNLINSNTIFENDTPNSQNNIHPPAPLVQHQYEVNAIHELKHTNNYKINVDNIDEKNNSLIPEELQPFNAPHIQNVGNFDETDKSQNYTHTIHLEKENEQNISDKESMKTNEYSNQIDDININESLQNKPNNLLTNQNINTEYEQATEIRPIINEENPTTKNYIAQDNTYVNENENIIHNHDIKEKHKKNSFQIDDNENRENNDRKNNINKPNKKKQNTI